MDSDFAADLDKRRSLTGYIFIISGCAVSWKATLHGVVAQSTTEAEYMAIAEEYKYSVWLNICLLSFVEMILELTCFVTVKVPFTLLRIRCFMREQSTLTSNTIMCVMLLHKLS